MNRTSPQGFFITGTDTDIGKTYITSMLLNAFSDTSSVTYMKPVQTGCFRDESGTFIIPDFDFVKKYSHRQIVSVLEDHVPYCFEPACSPHLAASLAKTEIDFKTIKTSYAKISQCVDYTFVEGAGGILAPLSESKFMIDLAQYLGIPVIIVTSGKLGTLNHTFLSINALKQWAVPVAGVIMNNSTNEPPDYIYHENSRMIRSFIAPTPFLEVSYGETDHESIKSFCQQIRSL